MEKVNSTTYKTKGGNIEFGDSKQSKFFPQFKTMHWGNECNLSVRLNKNYKDSQVILNEGKIEAVNGTEKIRFYELEGFEDGGFEFEVEYSEKPDTNILEFTLQDKGFTYFYQPELSEEQKKQGWNRPENVIGSYAVYHSSKKDNNYKTGKAFHIYRPFAIDANNNKVWCNLKIKNGLMTIETPQDFIDNAVYPIIIDPTLGYTSIGASTTTTSRGQATKFTTIEAGTLNDIVVYSRGGGTVNHRYGVFSDVGGSSPIDNKLGETADGSYDTSFAWRTLTLVTPYVFASSETLWLREIADDNIEYPYDSGSTEQHAQTNPEYELFFYSGFKDPVDSPDGLYDVVSSIYANYTASGAAPSKLALLGVG